MEIDLTQLESDGARVRESFEAGELGSAEGDRLAPLWAELEAWVRPEKGLVRASGTIRAGVRAECDRCLGSVEAEVSGEFDQRYALAGLAPETAESEVEASELDIEHREETVLDTRDLAREQIELHAPMGFLCSEGCKGLCPVCRADRNSVECGCQVEQTDPRWDALKNLKLN